MNEVRKMMQNVFRTFLNRMLESVSCWEKKSWGADDVAPDLRSLFGSVHLAELRGLGPCWPCLSWGVNEDNRFNRCEKAVNIWILHGTFDLLKAIWIYESCEITWNSQNPKIRSFPEVQGSFFGSFQTDESLVVFPGALWRSLREEALQAGARGRWTCEARRHEKNTSHTVATVDRDFFTVFTFFFSAEERSHHQSVVVGQCLVSWLWESFMAPFWEDDYQAKRCTPKSTIYIMALLRGGVDVNGFGCFWLHSQRNATLVVQRMGALVVRAEELSSCFGA